MPMNIAVSRHIELEWVNSSFKDEEAGSMKWGLAKTKFQYKRANRIENVVPEIWF
jgi:hypothetical protein